MDFLDSLDLHTRHNCKQDKKYDRMRSWYLYEQYKNLEQNQLDAAQRLRNRSLQERVLQRELAERRSRRRLYQPAGASRSEPQASRNPSNAGTCLSTTTDDFSESFCELHDFETCQEFAYNHSHHDSDNTFMEDFKLEEFQDDTSCAESVPSVVDLACSDKGDHGPQSVPRTIADSIKLHLETVKEDIVSLERYTRMADGDRASECSVRSRSKSDKVHYKAALLRDSQLFCMWSRLVEFAYHLVHLNHGNCYYDYSSQLLTAVLACDALRRGVNRMCDILQYYVSPIKYSSDESMASHVSSRKHKNKKSTRLSKKTQKSSKYKINSRFRRTNVKKRRDRSYHSDRLWQRGRQHSLESVERDIMSSSQRWGRNWNRPEQSHSDTSNTLWPEELDSVERCCRCRKVQNPMLKLVRYLDDILNADLEDFGQI